MEGSDWSAGGNRFLIGAALSNGGLWIGQQVAIDFLLALLCLMEGSDWSAGGNRFLIGAALSNGPMEGSDWSAVWLDFLD